MQGRALPHDHALNVEPVLRPVGNRLQDDEILGRARSNDGWRSEVEVRRPRDHALFERKRAKGNIDWHVRRAFDEHNAVLERKLPCVIDATSESGQKSIDEHRFTTGTGHEGDVDVARLTRLTPALNRQPTDHGVQPAAVAAERLELDRRRKQPVHGRRR